MLLTHFLTTRPLHQIHRPFPTLGRRSFASSQGRDLGGLPVDFNAKYDDDKPHPFPTARVHRTGTLANGSRQYIMLPPNNTLQDVKRDPSIRLASIFVHRNLIFGARVHSPWALEECDFPIAQVCLPLLRYAAQEAGELGHQPQALSTLYGMCDWVQACLDQELPSDVIQKLEGGQGFGDQVEDVTASIQLEAVRAIATGTPRPGHSVVGVGTFRDAQPAWEQLAREFVQRMPSDECRLYQSGDFTLLGIEYLADRKESYIQSAGGSMARFMVVH